MSSQRRSLAAIAASFTLVSTILVVGCQQESPAGPSVTDAKFAKGGGGGGPAVDAADPNSAPQDITLDVRVIGSGFDNGSVVKFLKGGQSTPKIVTNSSTFIDRKNIIANITIAVDAEVALYDIEVTTVRGKKGIGTELFSVKEKGKPGDEVFKYTITDLGAEGGVGDINDAGLIVGSAPSGGVAFRAARWTDPGAGYSMELLGDGVWESGPGSWATAVNGSGAAVGVVWIDADFTDRAALWSGGVRLFSPSRRGGSGV